MAQIALHTLLKAGHEADYDDVHQRIPREVAKALRQHGVHDWRIWRDGRHVVHLVDADDYQAMREGLRDLPAHIARQPTVAPFFERADSYDGDDTGSDFLWRLGGRLSSEPGA